MALKKTDRVRFNRMLRHVERIVAGAAKLEPKTRKKIIMKADKLWVGIRKAAKAQVWAEMQRAEVRS